MTRSFGLLATILAVAPFGTASLQARELTLEQRIHAQERIQRVYYSQQIGVTRPFEEAVPREILEKQVRTYLKQSVALEARWKTAVTTEMLHRELERMAAGTMMPERLRQLFAALGDDPFLIQECLARPVLVDRLARSFFSYDQAIHATNRRRAERLRHDLALGRIDPRSDHPSRSVIDIVRAEGGSNAELDGQRDRLPGVQREAAPFALTPEEFERLSRAVPQAVDDIEPLIEENETFLIRVALEKGEDHLRIASFAVPKTSWEEWWAAAGGQFDEGLVIGLAPKVDALPMPRDGASPDSLPTTCLPDDTWDTVSLHKAPDPRVAHVAVWTGSLMIVWGGSNTVYLNTGGRYDPATDSWRSIPAVFAPTARNGAVGVWTGNQLVIWGGSNGAFLNTGGRYDPISDTWKPISTIGAPTARNGHTVVWTGSRMIVWGGYNGAYLDTGGLYDPGSDTWTATSTAGAPSGRTGHSVIWTGSEMLVWGGYGPSLVNTGGRYDPSSNAWNGMSAIDAPTARWGHSVVWTGREMIVWGADGGPPYVNTGGRYNPSTDSWTATSSIGAPPGTSGRTAVWTGSKMIVWGGSNGSGAINSPPRGRYDPISDEWTTVSSLNGPSPRYQHSAVWTGALMIIWGGNNFGSYVSTGGRYDLQSDTWTPTNISNAPSPRDSHTSVWTGSLMVVWGGYFGSYFRSGGRYDPVLDTWKPMSTPSGFSARAYHTAVWAGGYMVVWGGFSGALLGDGRRYNPTTDTWLAVSSSGAPSARWSHTAVSTGAQMIVWGGRDTGTGVFNTGGLYDPASNVWTPISTDQTPLPRFDHSAVWTGSRMIVWGGTDNLELFNTGGSYDPATDSWSPASTINAPPGRHFHAAVWTGSRMVVWGGIGGTPAAPVVLDSGGRYDPVSGDWSPTSSADAPTPRSLPSAVWTGRLMVVWGGLGAAASSVDTGGRYDPVADMWSPTSVSGAPSPRVYHSAVWTGSFMIVWGGNPYYQPALDTGGRYALGHWSDDDGDGISECFGDCNDTDAGIRPGAVEACDGLDNDCSGVVDDAAPPSGTPLLTVDTTPEGATLVSWSPVVEATSYDSMRGDLSILMSSGGDFSAATQACLVNNFVGASYEVADMPSTGTGFWYLIRAVNCGGPGTYDSDGSGQVGLRDPGLAASPFACP